MNTEPSGPWRAVTLIPGAYERNTLTHRQPGSMGVSPADAMPDSPDLMDDATIAEREWEGGGAPDQRRRTAPTLTPAAPALSNAAVSGSWFTGGNLWFQIMRLARP